MVCGKFYIYYLYLKKVRQDKYLCLLSKSEKFDRCHSGSKSAKIPYTLTVIFVVFAP